MRNIIVAIIAGSLALMAGNPVQARTVVIERGGYGYPAGYGYQDGGYGGYPDYAPSAAPVVVPVRAVGPRMAQIVQGLRVACRAGDALSCRRLRGMTANSGPAVTPIPGYAGEPDGYDAASYGDGGYDQSGYQAQAYGTPIAAAGYGGGYGSGYGAGYGSNYGSSYGGYGSTPQTTVVVTGSNGGYGSNGYGSNGYGSNGYGSNGYGSNGYGSNYGNSSNYGSANYGNSNSSYSNRTTSTTSYTGGTNSGGNGGYRGGTQAASAQGTGNQGGGYRGGGQGGGNRGGGQGGGNHGGGQGGGRHR